MRDMNTNKTRTLLFGSAIAVAMLVGGVVGATVLAKSTLAPANAAPLAVATATPASNEATAHEKAESPAQETAENNGTARPAGAPLGPSNEDPTHEAAEPAAREAAETT
jgi:hypothetical protein